MAIIDWASSVSSLQALVAAQSAGNVWVGDTTFPVGAYIVPFETGEIETLPTATANAYYYKCTVAGTTASAAPEFPTTIGASVTDGTVTWECIGTSTTPFLEYASGSAQTTITYLETYGPLYDAAGSPPSDGGWDVADALTIGINCASTIIAAWPFVPPTGPTFTAPKLT